MRNRFTVTIEFSYKGETYAPQAVVDLDEQMQLHGTVAPLHDIVAKRNGIDPYSYQYEVLHAEELAFSDVEGFAAEFIHAGEFDVEGFAARWREERINTITAEIAQRLLGIAELSTQPALQQALQEAYRAGQMAAASGE